MEEGRQFFFDSAGDRRMEEQNVARWQALARHVENARRHASLPQRDWNILDIGSHAGGLLALFKKEFGGRLKNIFGVEPIEYARTVARETVPDALFFRTIEEIPNQSITVAVSNEVLYLIPNLEAWMFELKRILQPGGMAFIALGSHAENTAWLRWRHQLKTLYGHISYVHDPINILALGVRADFDVEIARLSVGDLDVHRYDLPEDGWGDFASAEELFNFYERWKYVFIFRSQE